MKWICGRNYKGGNERKRFGFQDWRSRSLGYHNPPNQLLLKLPNQLFTRLAHSLRMYNPFSYEQLDWHVKCPIIGYQQTIIHIIHPIVIAGQRLMMAPTSHEADMMGALEQQSGVAMWRNGRRMFEHVVNRPEMWMTNDQCWFLIKLMSVIHGAVSDWIM